MSWMKEPCIWGTGRAERKIWTAFSWESATLWGNNPLTRPDPQLLDPRRTEDNVCQHWPVWVVRRGPASKATEEGAGGEEEDAACPALCPQGSLSSALTHHLHGKSLTAAASAEDWTGATQRVCCIYSTPQKWTVLERERAPQRNPRTGKKDAWWPKLPHQMTSHKLIWRLVRRAKLTGRLSIAIFPSCSSKFFPSCLTTKRAEFRVSPLSSWEWADLYARDIYVEEETRAAENSGS